MWGWLGRGFTSPPTLLRPVPSVLSAGWVYALILIEMGEGIVYVNVCIRVRRLGRGVTSSPILLLTLQPIPHVLIVGRDHVRVLVEVGRCGLGVSI